MPLITVKLCPRCEKKSCDGSLWKVVKAEPPIAGEWGTFPVCGHQAFGGGRALRAMPIPDVPVGTQVKRNYHNWVIPTVVTYEKVED